MRHWPKRKLSKADGEYILWHVIEHLQSEQGSSTFNLNSVPEAIETLRELIETLIEENGSF